MVIIRHCIHEAVPPRSLIARGFAIAALVAAQVCTWATPSSSECIDYRSFLRWVGAAAVPGAPQRVAVVGSYAYVAVQPLTVSQTSSLQIVDISNASDPTVVGSVVVPGLPIGVAVAGSIAYVAAGEAGLLVIDVADVFTPVIVGSLDTPGSARDVEVPATMRTSRMGQADCR